MRPLLDTCILIDLLRNNAAAVAFAGASSEKPAICPVSIMELYAGARSQREDQQIGRLIHIFDVMAIEAATFQRAGQLLKHYRASHSLDTADALIAATAEQHGLRLATLNVKHFPMFQKLKPPY